jgi:hypothetical protein
MYMWRDVFYSYEVTVGEEGSRSSGLANCFLVTDCSLTYCSSVQVDRSPMRDCPAVFGKFPIIL